MRTTLKDIVQYLIVSALSAPVVAFLVSLGFWVLLAILAWAATYPMTWIVGKEAASNFIQMVPTDKTYGIIYALVVTLIIIEDLGVMIVRNNLFLTKLRISQMLHEAIHGALFKNS